MHRRKFVQLIVSAGAGGLVSAAAATSKASASTGSHTLVLHVKGFSCITCAVGLDTMLQQKPGVASSHSTYPEGRLVIQFDPAKVTEAELHSFIGEMGFTVATQFDKGEEPMNYSCSDVAAQMTQALSLQQVPVAIRFADSVPAGVSRFDRRVPAGCKFWEEAAGATFATASEDHSLCAIGVYTHNLEGSPRQQQDLQDALTVFADLGYLAPSDLPFVPVLNVQPKFVIYAPLAESTQSPDVVLLFVNASQALIVSEAVQQAENHLPPAMGRPACAVVAQVMNTGRAALSAGCCGARAYLDRLTEEVVLFALPGENLEVYVARIQALSRANNVLTRFHQLRRADVAAGAAPTIQESLARMQTS